MGVNHKRVGLLLSRYVDQELKDHERSALELHLKECAPCREQLQEYQSVSRCLAISAPIEAAPYLWTRTRQAIHDSIQPVGLMARLRPALVPIAGAALVIAALVTGFQLTRTVSQGKRQMEIQAINPEFGDGTAPVLHEIVPDDTLDKDSLN